MAIMKNSLKTLLPKYRSIDSSWECDDVIVLPLEKPNAYLHTCLIYHTTSLGRMKYVVHYGMKHQIYQHFINGLIWFEFERDIAKQLTLVKNGCAVFSLRYYEGVLIDIGFHHQGSNKLSGISKKHATTQRTSAKWRGTEYSVT